MSEEVLPQRFTEICTKVHGVKISSLINIVKLRVDLV